MKTSIISIVVAVVLSVFSMEVHADSLHVQDFSMNLSGWKVHDISGYHRKKEGSKFEWVGWAQKGENSLSVQMRDPTDKPFEDWVKEAEEQALGWYMNYCKCHSYKITSTKKRSGVLDAPNLTSVTYQVNEYDLKKGSAGRKDRAAVLTLSVKGTLYYVIIYDTNAVSLSDGEGILVAEEVLSSINR
ncbi:hypothetical protein ACFL6I_18195 [candidate division KSB1 bacterium]